MNREEFGTCYNREEYYYNEQLQKHLIPIVYGLNDSFKVREVDLSPGDNTIAVYGFYLRESCIIKFFAQDDSVNIYGNAEILIDRIPDDIPNVFFAAFPRPLQGFPFHLVYRPPNLILLSQLENLSKTEYLKDILDQLIVHKKKLIPLLKKESVGESPDGLQAGDVIVSTNNNTIN